MDGKLDSTLCCFKELHKILQIIVVQYFKEDGNFAFHIHPLRTRDQATSQFNMILQLLLKERMRGHFRTNTDKNMKTN